MVPISICFRTCTTFSQRGVPKPQHARTHARTAPKPRHSMPQSHSPTTPRRVWPDAQCHCAHTGTAQCGRPVGVYGPPTGRARLCGAAVETGSSALLTQCVRLQTHGTSLPSTKLRSRARGAVLAATPPPAAPQHSCVICASRCRAACGARMQRTAGSGRRTDERFRAATV